MKDNSKEVLYGIYSDDDVMLDAIHKAHDEHLDIMDVFTPFPVHGLDKAMHLEESRLHIAGFIYGIIGTMVAFGFMSWVSVPLGPFTVTSVSSTFIVTPAGMLMGNFPILDILLSSY